MISFSEDILLNWSPLLSLAAFLIGLLSPFILFLFEYLRFEELIWEASSMSSLIDMSPISESISPSSRTTPPDLQNVLFYRDENFGTEVLHQKCINCNRISFVLKCVNVATFVNWANLSVDMRLYSKLVGKLCKNIQICNCNL